MMRNSGRPFFFDGKVNVPHKNTELVFCGSSIVGKPGVFNQHYGAGDWTQLVNSQKGSHLRVARL